MNDDTALYAALGAFVSADDDYTAKAEYARTRPRDSDAQAACHIAHWHYEQAKAALLAAWHAAQADPIPALLERLEAVEVTRPTVAPGERLEEQIVGAEVQP